MHFSGKYKSLLTLASHDKNGVNFDCIQDVTNNGWSFVDDLDFEVKERIVDLREILATVDAMAVLDVCCVQEK